MEKMNREVRERGIYIYREREREKNREENRIVWTENAKVKQEEDLQVVSSYEATTLSGRLREREREESER